MAIVNSEMNVETVFVDFKKRGIKASMNKVDFDPNVHTLWSDKDDKKAEAPLPEAPNAPPPAPGTQPWKAAPVRKGK